MHAPGHHHHQQQQQQQQLPAHPQRPPEPVPPAEALFGGAHAILVRAGVPTTLLPHCDGGSGGSSANGGGGAAHADGRASPSASAAAASADGGTLPLDGGASGVAEFETDLFRGKVKVVFRMPPELQGAEAAALLQGKRRQMWVMVQGRLKRAVPLDDLLFGSFFSRPLRFPAQIIVAPAVKWLAARLGSSLQLQLRGSSPYVMGPLCAAVQMLNVSRPGEEPDLVATSDDTRLLLGPEAMAGEPMPAAKRRAYFRRAANRKGRVWTPDHVITLHCFDHSFDYHTFKMAVPPCFHLDMVKVLDGQPVDLSLRDRRTGEWVLRWEVWPRRALPYLERRRARAAAAAAGRRGASSGAGGAGSGSVVSGGAAALSAAESARSLAAREALAAHQISFEGGSSSDGGSGAGGASDAGISSPNGGAGGGGGSGASSDSGWGSGCDEAAAAAAAEALAAAALEGDAAGCGGLEDDEGPPEDEDGAAGALAGGGGAWSTAAAAAAAGRQGGAKAARGAGGAGGGASAQSPANA